MLLYQCRYWLDVTKGTWKTQMREVRRHVSKKTSSRTKRNVPPVTTAVFFGFIS
jgi:hypothetical protein